MNIMTYERTLELSHIHGINAVALMVAVEVEFQLSARQIRFSHDYFETVCDYVETAYMKSENISIEAVASALGYLIDNDMQITVDTLQKEACNFV